jgi:hypothetical protein
MLNSSTIQEFNLKYPNQNMMSADIEKTLNFHMKESPRLLNKARNATNQTNSLKI